MPPDDPRGARPAPVVLRIKLRYDDVETLAARFAPNVGKSGLFLPTKSLQAVGAEVKFELRLSDDKVVITGLGKVRAAKAPDPDNPRAAFGMAIELTRVTRESRDVMLKILAKRRELGLADVAIPMPADIDAAKAEATNTGTGSAPSAIPTASPTTIDSGPVRESGPIGTGRDSAPILDSGPIRDSQPILDSAPLPRKEPEQARVLTAPRRASGPIAIAKVHAVSALGPEPPRKKRPALQEVIDRASGPVAAVTVNLPGLDDDVDVNAVMAMARALAGSDLDAELEQLRDSASAPIEITVEAASAELARQLGGVAVRRGWAPPPPVEESKPIAAREPIDHVEPATDVVANQEPATESNGLAKAEPAAPEAVVEAPASDAAVEALPSEAVVEAPASDAVVEASAPEVEPESTPVSEPPPEPEAAAFVAATTDVEPATEPPAASMTPEFALSDEDDVPGEDHEVDPEQIADEIHQLGEEDFEEVEHTAVGTEPPEPEPPPMYTEPAVAAAIEASLDQQLADADAEPDDLGFSQHAYAEQPAYAEPGYAEQPAYAEPGYAEPAYAEPAYAEPAYAEPAYAEPAYAEPAYADPATVEPVAEYNEEELEEIEDFEILAEADEEDADLLSAHGEQEASGSGAVYPDHEPQPEPVPRASYDYARHSDPDFHARLELSDEHPRAPVHDEDDDEPPLHLDPRELSARNAIAAFEEPQNAYEPMNELSLGEDLPADDFDSPHADFNKPSAYARAAPVGFPPLSKFDESDVHSIAPEAEPRYLRSQQTAPPPKKGDDGYDLETALEALDVDLDDLSIPHAKTERGPTIPPANRPRTGSQRMPRVQTRVPQRPTTDDGVLIDFDDDEE